eukprot:TRINITY_DN4105_c0_g1_i3.p1 TRINITY_DN4105_c0_g1~~TRINITY_DN4105_c0_g1_i3.p1  ORF type:complete len:317 (+),score=76.05 TRINITY_DN4105_c0_g1_i3:86-1036(+)
MSTTSITPTTTPTTTSTTSTTPTARTSFTRTANISDFTYENIMRDPKGDHGTVSIDRADQWHVDMHYSLLETGGFLRLYTLRGRTYWHAQNILGHLTPDWKIHFSVVNADLPQAWNILSTLFMQSRCDIGMKVTTLPGGFDGDNGQRGREITVYVYKYHDEFGFGPMFYDNKFIGECKDEESLYYLGQEFEGPYDSKFWFNFLVRAEERLKSAGIRSNGLADGDHALPGCTYASLRNEAFVVIRDEQGFESPQYPPNNYGWNAVKQHNPLTETEKMLKEVHSPTLYFLEENALRMSVLLVVLSGIIVLHLVRPIHK